MQISDKIFEKLKPKGFISEFSEAILADIPTSPDWAESIALTVEATVLGKVRVLTKIGPLSLNLWNLMIGPSGLAYKSTPLLYYVYPTLAAVTQMIDKPVIMPGRFTLEGMIEYLSKKHEKGPMQGMPLHEEGCIIRDEFTSLFKSVYRKGYMADMMEFLSELFDGTMQKRYTRSYKLEHSENVYISLLAATTPYLFSVMEREFFVQGTGNRILFTMFEPVELPVIDPENFFVSGEDQRNRILTNKEFSDKLVDMYNSNLRYIFPMPEAAKLWAEYKMEKDKEAAYKYRNNPQDLEYSYLQRMPEMSLKLAGLATVSRAQNTIAELSGDTMMIREDDMRWALMKAEKHLGHFRTLLDRWVVTPTSKPVEIEERELRYVLSFVEGNRDELLTQREILRLTGYSKSTKFLNLLGTLVSRGDLVKMRREDILALVPETRARHGLGSFRGTIPSVFKIAEKDFNRLKSNEN